MENHIRRFVITLFLLLFTTPLFTVSGQKQVASQKLHLITVKTSEDLRNLFHYNKVTFPVICAHRGGSQKDFPENCIKTYENTIKYTFALMECDPRYTKDSMLVLNHDPVLERTTNGKGKVIDYTLKELETLRLKDTRGNITGNQMTTLDEALEWAKGKAILLLDQKDVSVAARVKKVEEHEAVPNAILTIYSFQDAKLCYQLNNKLMMQVFIPTMEKALEFDRTGVPWANVIASVGHGLPTDSKLIAFIHQKGTICTAASMETIDIKFLNGKVPDFKLLKKDYTAFLSMGVDMLQTDLPTQLGPLLYENDANYSSNIKFLKIK